MADGDAVAVIDVSRATSSGSGALLGYLQTGFGAGTFELAVDGDKYLFTADEDTGAVTMFDLTRIRSGDLSSRSKLHSIVLGLATTDVAVGSSGRYLYAVSQLKRPPIDLAPTDLIYGFITEAGLAHKAGLLDVIDIARWADGQGSPIAAEVLAGCSPVRVVPDEAEANIWVSARESNEVIGFNLTRLLAGSSAPSAEATVGPSPVGMALVGGGNYLLAVNSNRFGNTTAPQTATLLHIASGGTSLSTAGAYRTGGFPREIAVSPSGLTAYVIDNGSSEITVIDLTELPF